MHATNNKAKTQNAIIENPFLKNLINSEGPSALQYQAVEELVNQVSTQKEENMISETELNWIIEQCNFLKTNETIMGHIRNKPYGYAGDFEIIDKIYLNKPTSSQYSNWDRFALSNAAAKAVRNRKTFFKNTMLDLLRYQDSMDLLNIASGPARDLKELYELLGLTKNVSSTCVELDPKAIAHAKNLNNAFISNIEFIHKNILRFNTEKKYDVIWSAGLFDYFNDKAFVLLLSRFMTWLKPNGRIIIGNFNEKHNPSRPFMELFGDWYLNHRSPLKLRQLAIQAGAENNEITIKQEKEGINLFLEVRKLKG